MKKYYFDNTDDWDAIKDYEIEGLEQDYDGYYLTNKDEFLWWSETAEAIVYLESNGVNITFMDFDNILYCYGALLDGDTTPDKINQIDFR